MSKLDFCVKHMIVCLLGTLMLLSCGGDPTTESSAPVNEQADESFRNALRENLSDIAATNEAAEQELKKAEEKRLAEEERVRNSKKVYNVYISAIHGSQIKNATTDHGEVELWGFGATRTEVHLVDYVPQGKAYILDYVESQKSNSSYLYAEHIGIGQPGKYTNKKWIFGKQKDYIVVRGGNHFSLVLNPCNDGEVNYTIGFSVKDESELW